MTKKEILDEIRDKIIEKLNQGVNPWMKPWSRIRTFNPELFAYNYKSKKAYTGINQVLLEPGLYLTFNQIKELNWSLKKGSKASKIVHFEKRIREATKEELELIEAEDIQITPNCFFSVKNGIYFLGNNNVIMRYFSNMSQFSVFNIKDVKEFEEDMLKPEEAEPLNDEVRIETAENVIEDYKKRANLKIHECENDSAFYSPVLHSVTVPSLAQFKNKNEFYSTLFHELAHSTGHKSLLNRFGEGSTSFGSDKYSKEELIAEITASYSLGYLEISDENVFQNNVAYLKSWANHIRNDEEIAKSIMTASNKANDAFNLIFNF